MLTCGDVSPIAGQRADQEVVGPGLRAGLAPQLTEHTVLAVAKHAVGASVLVLCLDALCWRHVITSALRPSSACPRARTSTLTSKCPPYPGTGCTKAGLSRGPLYMGTCISPTCVARTPLSQSVRRLSEGHGRTSTSKLVCCAITRAVFAVSTPPVDSSNGANILKSQMPDALAIEATMERCFENVVGPTAKKGVERSQPFHYRGCRDSYFDRSLRNPHTPPKTPCGWGHKSFTR